jgi:hypothetical protein
MLYSYETFRPIAQEVLISRKIDFLKSLPVISRERDRGLDYQAIPQLPQHRPGLQKRVARLLGLDQAIEDHMIIVEHLLLRPKFPGDALMHVCLGEDCSNCSGQDPYSFQLSVIMPGWMSPFDENLELRRFADRTIRLETPSHLLAKICWIGNADTIDVLCGDAVGKVADKLEKKGSSTEGACKCAQTIYEQLNGLFKEWYAENFLRFLHADFVHAELEKKFTSFNRSDLPCADVLDDALWGEIVSIMADDFQEMAISGCQYERFQFAWSKWLEANAAIEWTEERLLESIISLLSADPAAAGVSKDTVCKCALNILTKYGLGFSAWIDGNLQDGRTLDKLTAMRRDSIAPCDSIKFSADTEKKIAELLRIRYKKYTPVSYYLRIVVDLLGKLRNIYPGATLHDCDDGNDVNPVRLGSTALGIHSLRQSATGSPAPVVPPIPESVMPGSAKRPGRPGAGAPSKTKATEPEETKGSNVPKPKTPTGTSKASNKQKRPRKRK